MNIHRLVLGALGTNCYVLSDEETKNAIIIDAPDEAEKIISYINESRLSVKAIVLTHGHFDHILALREIKFLTNAPIYAHVNSKRFLHDGTDNLCHYVGIEWTPIDIDITLNDGDSVAVGEISLNVLHTPGHTSDCISLYGNDVLFSGDTLFAGSIGRTDHPTGSMEQEINSIKQKLLCLPDSTPVYPGHGQSTTIGKERSENPYLR